MRRHGYIWRISNDLIADSPFSICWITSREVEWAGNDTYRWISVCQASTEILKVRPIIAVETVSNLRAHVCEVECRIHRFLREFGVGCRNLVATIIAGTKIVHQLRSKLLRHREVFHKGRV